MFFRSGAGIRDAEKQSPIGRATWVASSAATTGFCLFVLLSGCAQSPLKKAPPDAVASDAIVIQDDWATALLSRENYFQEMGRCFRLGEKASQSLTFMDDLKKFPESTNVLKAFSRPGSSSVFLVRGDSGVCVAYTQGGFPIIPLSAFAKTIELKGLPQDVSNDWNKQIALALARNGKVTVKYVFPNNWSAFVDYWFEQNSPRLFYKLQDNFAIDNKNQRFDLQFTNGLMTSVISSQYGGPKNSKTYF
ncbi:hypothetical protein [Viridibacterium curvum]|uniref:Uncharacterized protein n=1 Tax=Viridibacterium curvum TaxID=1101404 RepID=A0ABP9R3W4_9RHOO